MSSLWQSFAISMTLSLARGAKQLVVLSTATILFAPSSSMFALIASRSVTSWSPSKMFSMTTGRRPAAVMHFKHVFWSILKYRQRSSVENIKYFTVHEIYLGLRKHFSIWYDPPRGATLLLLAGWSQVMDDVSLLQRASYLPMFCDLALACVLGLGLKSYVAVAGEASWE